MFSDRVLSEIRSQYPLLLRQGPGERQVVYLDSAATALKPNAVIDAVVDVLSRRTGNVHRGVHFLGDDATALYEQARQVVADFVGVEEQEVVFVRNTTEALNLVAQSPLAAVRIVVSLGEHHSNLLPWTHDVTRLAPGADGLLDLDALEIELAKGGVGLVSAAHVSNVTGRMIDVARTADLTHRYGALLMLDAAQSAPHEPINMAAWKCDLLAFSGHKLGSPTGVGALCGRIDLLEKIRWHYRGGATVNEVHRDSEEFKSIPWRLEAGTPPVESAVGLAAAIRQLERIGPTDIQRHQQALATVTVEALHEHLPQAEILGGDTGLRCGPVSFHVPGISPHLIARTLSDSFSTCIRSGYHCAQPLHEFFGWPGSVRISPYLYNTEDEIRSTVGAIADVVTMQRRI